MDLLKRKEALMNTIQQKKELKGIARSVIALALNTYLKKHRLALTALTPKEEKLLMKEVRSQLRRSTGMFYHSLPQEHLPLTSQLIKALLASHASTTSRTADYPFLRREFTARNVHAVLDLGSGLNPLALAQKGMHYIAIDIREDELALLQHFFKEKGVHGVTLLCDLRHALPDVPPVDACLLMNVLEIIETNKRTHERAAALLSSVHARFFFITFSTRTLSGKRMRFPDRPWFERLLASLGFRWQKHLLSTEVLYIAERSAI